MLPSIDWFTHVALRYAETDLSISNARAYLTDPTKADELKAKRTYDIMDQGSYAKSLSSDFLDGISGDPEKGVLLIEGAVASEFPLRLEVWKGGAKRAEFLFQIQISGIEKMYRWVNLRGIPDTAPDAGGDPLGEVELPTNTGEPSNRPDDETTDKHFIMVHGYSVSEDSARGWGAEVFKRLYQLGMNAKFTMIAWTGNFSQIPEGVWVVGGNTPDYWENVTNAFITSPYLKTAVDALPGTQKIIAGHSLGNMVISSAIKDHGLAVERYFMLDAAVPLEAYQASQQNETSIGLMRHPDWQQYNTVPLRPYWSAFWWQQFEEEDGRRHLTWRNRFGDIPNAINYYSSGEEVLRNSDGGMPWGVTATRAWVYSEMGKGREDSLFALVPPAAEDIQAGWGYNNVHEIYMDDLGYVQLTPAALPNAVSLLQTKTTPFFAPFQIEELMDPELGSPYASRYWERAKTLAEGIPALSFAAGSNPIPAFGTTRNIDLMTLKTDWPEARPKMSATDSRREWHHSDAKNVAFRYNYRLYEDWIENGKLTSNLNEDN